MSYESQLFLVLIASALVSSVGIYAVNHIRHRLRRRAARRRMRGRRAQSPASPS